MANLARPELATAPYIVRNEFFGCLIYERETGKYFALDKDILKLLRASQQKSLDQVFAEVYGERAELCDGHHKDYRADFDQLVKIFEIGHIMENGRYRGIFLDNEVPTGCKALVAPTEINFQLTASCPNNCNYCWVKRSNSLVAGADLRTEEVKELLLQLVKSGTYVINLGGGCAISRSDFSSLVNFANELGMYVNLSVEGAALDKKRIDMLASLNVRSYRIGLAAGTDKVWETMRGGGESSQRGFMSKVKALVSKLKSVRSTAHIEFRAVVVDANRDEMSTLTSKLNGLVRELGLPKVVLHLDPALPIGTKSNQDSRIFLSPDKIMSFLDWINDYRARQTAGDSIDIVTSAEVPTSVHKNGNDGFGCDCGFRSGYISAKGYLYPSAAVVGVVDSNDSNNLRKCQFNVARIWQQAPLFRNLRGQVANEMCKGCREFANCHGGCRSRALLANPKSWRAMDPWCRLAYEKDKAKDVCREYGTKRS